MEDASHRLQRIEELLEGGMERDLAAAGDEARELKNALRARCAEVAYSIPTRSPKMRKRLEYKRLVLSSEQASAALLAARTRAQL